MASLVTQHKYQSPYRDHPLQLCWLLLLVQERLSACSLNTSSRLPYCPRAYANALFHAWNSLGYPHGSLPHFLQAFTHMLVFQLLFSQSFFSVVLHPLVFCPTNEIILKELLCCLMLHNKSYQNLMG